MGESSPTGEAHVLAADAVLEMMGRSKAEATCALLTPAIQASLRDMQPGQVLEVCVDDPTAYEDIASWCRLTGNTLIGTMEEPPRIRRFYVRKKQA